MRPLAPALVLLLLVPSAAAEFGEDDAMGWPIAADGTRTFPGGILPAGVVPDGPVNAVGPFTVYPYYPVLTAEVNRLATEHPDIVRLHSIGKSTLGLDLWMLEIADHDRIEAGEGIPLDEREVVWVDGGTHSNEYSGVWFVAHLASFLADGYGENETATWIVENRHTFLMPLVNPDGSHAFGRLNARAVNINRNYPVAWGALDENPLFNNPGPSPASEVETRANIAWANKTGPDLYVSVHCCGNLWLYPYGVEGLDPLDQKTLARVCEEAFPTVRADCGPIWSTIYPASGSSVDTVYEYTGAVAFGYEMSGRGAAALWGLPFTSAAVETEEIESWEGLLHGFLNVERYGAYPVLASAAIEGTTITLTIRNDGYGDLTNWSIEGKPLPTLLPGGTTTVTLDAPAVAGPLEVLVSYTKRHMASPQGARTLALEVREGPDGLVLYAEDAPIATLAADAKAGVPGPGLLLLLAVGAAAAVALRRR